MVHLFSFSLDSSPENNHWLEAKGKGSLLQSSTLEEGPYAESDHTRIMDVKDLKKKGTLNPDSKHVMVFHKTDKKVLRFIRHFENCILLCCGLWIGAPT